MSAKNAITSPAWQGVPLSQAVSCPPIRRSCVQLHNTQYKQQLLLQLLLIQQIDTPTEPAVAVGSSPSVLHQCQAGITISTLLLQLQALALQLVQLLL